MTYVPEIASKIVTAFNFHLHGSVRDHCLVFDDRDIAVRINWQDGLTVYDRIDCRTGGDASFTVHGEEARAYLLAIAHRFESVEVEMLEEALVMMIGDAPSPATQASEPTPATDDEEAESAELTEGCRVETISGAGTLRHIRPQSGYTVYEVDLDGEGGFGSASGEFAHEELGTL